MSSVAGATRLRGLFTSMSCEWATPQAFFDALNLEFGGFDLDACATKDNAKARFFNDGDELVSGLAVPWRGKVWCNPPYHPRVLGLWVRKAYESAEAGALVVCLVPARTDTSWWHDYALKGEVRFLRGRGHFVGPNGKRSSEPFASALVIFRPARPQ